MPILIWAVRKRQPVTLGGAEMDKLKYKVKNVLIPMAIILAIACVAGMITNT
jgi:hypothetical protein